MRIARILFLDDDENRSAYMHRHFDGDSRYLVSYTQTAAECALRLVVEEPFDLVMLDHDLGGEKNVSTVVENSGSGVARFIRDQLDPGHYPKRIMVHSSNPPGSTYMAGIFRELGIPCVCRVFAT